MKGIYDEKVHELKTWPDMFGETWRERKKFEARKNDRNFETGDILKLQEYIPQTKEYTGREILAKVHEVYTNIPDMPEDHCIMQIKVIALSPRPFE
jgi:hypothetical protein